MKVEATLFLSKQKPCAMTSADGQFALRLRAFDRSVAHQTEPWQLIWPGTEAQAFWQTHGDALVPGAELVVSARRVRCLQPGGKQSGAEIIASVTRIFLPITARKSSQLSPTQSPCSPNAAYAISY